MNAPTIRFSLAPRVAISFLCMLLAAVSFGGGGETGTGGRMTSFARITDFGSIWVNGVEFFTTSAAITIDNVPQQPESALKAGMVVKVQGDLASNKLSGIATSVLHNTDLRGAVDVSPSATAQGFTFTVHGLQVRTDGRTIVAGSPGAGLIAAAQRVSVSGLRDGADGSLRASRIDVLSASTGTVLRGTALSISGTSFTLGATNVNAAGAALRFITWADIAAGVEIRVRSAANVASNTLVADEIERAESLAGNLVSSNEVEVEGLVAGANSSGQFMLNGVNVTTSGATVYENGTSADLVNGTSVEVKGVASGVASVNAERVKFSSPEAIDVQASVVSKTANSITLLSAGNNVVFTMNATTLYKDSSRAKLSNFTFAQIAVGDTVLARGTVANSGTVAARIERMRPEAGFAIKTRMFEATSGALVLDNAIVSTNAATLYFDTNAAAMSKAAFMARAIGLRIQARGAVNGNSLTASSVTIQ
jgi:Domain of unknown function (DUF5666)